MDPGQTNPRQGWFTSHRERNLWFWAALAVAAIFSTLGLARVLSDALAGTGFGEFLFMAACLLVLITVVTDGFISRPCGLELFVALGIVSIYMLIFVRMAVPTERSHLIEYGVVALLIYEALRERAGQGRSIRVPALLAIVLASIIGLVDEGIQWLMPGRFGEWTDVLFNVLAATLAVTGSASLRLARNWSRSVRKN